MRLRSAAALLLAALCLSGCGAWEAPEGWTALAMARETAGEYAPELAELAPGSRLYQEYVQDIYGLDAASISDGAVLAGSPAMEAAVFRFTDADAAERASYRLREYRDARVSAFSGYMPREAEMIEQGLICLRGEYCALILLPDADAARGRFEACFDSAPPEDAAPAASPGPSATPEPAEASGWSYDEARIISAWRSGEREGLDEHDLAILERVEYVLTEIAPDTLSPYERELAIHDYIVGCVEYDSDELSSLPGRGGANNTNPYGALVEGFAVCSGYSSSFQLLATLAGLECITVRGEANMIREEHAWNMVRLDGEWYCVDVTWDDPSGLGRVSEELKHRYFNVTGEFMRATRHYWDEDSVPEATGTKYVWTP